MGVTIVLDLSFFVILMLRLFCSKSEHTVSEIKYRCRTYSRE